MTLAAPQRLAASAVRLAEDLPPELLERLAQALVQRGGEDKAYVRQRLLQITPQPHFQAAITAFLLARQEQAATLSPAEVAAILLTAAAMARHQRTAHTVDLVWTGPSILEVPLRRTDQALLEVIEAAQSTLLIVSFAVYKIPDITQALLRAFERGVLLQICIERSEPGEDDSTYDTLAALGCDIQRRAEIYSWPHAQRPCNAHGKPGILHAKCAVADEQLLFLSSANLTEYAMQFNLELGVLIRGGGLPRTVVRQFAGLMERGILQRVSQVE